MAKITYYQCDICNKAYNELYEKNLRPIDFDFALLLKNFKEGVDNNDNSN